MVTNMMVLEPLEELWATSFIGLLFSVTEVHFDSNVFLIHHVTYTCVIWNAFKNPLYYHAYDSYVIIATRGFLVFHKLCHHTVVTR